MWLQKYNVKRNKGGIDILGTALVGAAPLSSVSVYHQRGLHSWA